ncbi:unnamed protein product [Arctia plantaginis]|uniref:FP protein C-terminal domain-containing protein n=1 Tax=Arctia plantaginis TaxID=874455 RepID=A0A8S0YM88_ARCPL|nr:unnamed protein product [Arctia plantaginis]
MLANVQQQQIAQASKLDTEMNKMIKQNTDIKTSIETMSDKYDEILQELKQTKAENTAIKKEIKLFEQKIELLERNAKASTLELRNIPEQQSENKSTLVSLVKNIGDVLGVGVRETDIRNIFRPKMSQNKIAPVIVEFSATTLKENMLKTSKTFNKENKEKLNTGHLKLAGESKPIFVSESLTSNGRRLYFLARQSVKNNKYAGCWTSYGRVYIRQKEGGPSKLISCEADLTTLRAQ